MIETADKIIDTEQESQLYPEEVTEICEFLPLMTCANVVKEPPSALFQASIDGHDSGECDDAISEASSLPSDEVTIPDENDSDTAEAVINFSVLPTNSCGTAASCSGSPFGEGK